MSKTPKELGYRMPAEWEPHAATWLSWPKKENSWPGKLERIPPIWVAMVAALCEAETVNILVDDAETQQRVEKILRAADIPADGVMLHLVPTDDAWMRDSGPIFVTRTQDGKTQLALTDWIYNAWGKKYPPWQLDNRVPKALAKILNLPRFEGGMVLEGGSIDVNGAGLLLTSEACLLNPNRNPQLSKEDIEERLKAYLGVSKILWLGEGIVGDDTDGHIDDLARFVAPNVVLIVVEEDPRDDNYHLLQDNWERLRHMTNLSGRPLDIITVPMPSPVIYDGTRLPASYANFYIGNRVVLAPIFNHKNDARALETLARLFPTRRIVGIDCTDLVWGLGAFHCVTQQQPAV